MVQSRLLPGRERGTKHIVRPRVLAAFAEAAQSDVVLVAAAAGYGKSVALRQHLQAIGTQGIAYELRRGFDVVDVFRALATLAGASEGLRTMVHTVAERGLMPYAARWLGERIDERRCDWVALDDVGSASADVRLFLSELLAHSGASRWYAVVGEAEDLHLGPLLAEGRLGPAVDADVLAFDVDEIEELGRLRNAQLTTEQALALKVSTAGWPVAVSISLQLSDEGRFSEAALPRAREALARYIVDRVRESLGPSERELLSWAAYVPLRSDLLEQLGLHDARRSLQRLDRVNPLLRATDNGFAVHGTLMETLASEEALTAPEKRADKWRRVGDAYLAFGMHGDALRSYLNGQKPMRLLPLLRDFGDRLYECGFGADIVRGLAMIPQQERRAEPALLLLEATAEVERGRKDVAEDLLRLASSAGGVDGRTAAVRLATELVNRGRRGAADVLRPVAFMYPDDAEVQSAFAVALAAAGEFSMLGAVVDAGVRAARRCSEPLKAARAWQRLGLAAHFAGTPRVARDRCEIALEIAIAEGLDGVEARIRSLLYNIAVAEDDEDAIVAEARRMVVAARRCGLRQIEMAGLTALLVDAAEVGDDAAFAKAESELAGLGPVRGYGDALPHAFARALGETRRGRFASAMAGLDRIVSENDEPPEIVACAEAISTLIAVSRQSGTSRARLSVMRSRTRSFGVDPRGATSRTSVLLHAVVAAVEASRGHRSLASRAARDAVKAARNRRERELAKAAHGLALAEDRHAWSCVISELRDAGLSGYAQLFDMLAPAADRAPTSILSLSEREILRLYSERRQAKEIADLLDRRVETVRTHIRNGTKKLGVKGREALINLAATRPDFWNAPTQH
jgi:LuxR family maltose regulon positive regulatory protein